MIVKRGQSTYLYQSIRENGEPKTLYKGKISCQQLTEHERRKQETQQHRQREQELQQLNRELENALKIIKITERAYLLLAGLYERKSEIRKLQEEHCAQ